MGRKLLLPIALLILGLGMVFSRVAGLHGGWMSADVDALVNHYFLEHSFRVFFDPAYPFAFWSPGFFYPCPNMLAYSDNLVGSAPLYWLARAFLAPPAAWCAWIAACLTLNFVCYFWFLRDQRIAPALCALGAFVFAFCLPRLAHLAHAQLLPQFYTPLALLFLVRFLRAPSARDAAAAAACVVLQVLAGIYLGWFLLFGLAVWLVLALALDRDTRTRVGAWLGRRPVAAAAIAVLAAGALVVFLLPYLRLAKDEGGNPLDVILVFMPRLASWFRAPTGSGWGRVLGHVGVSLPEPQEHVLFAGIALPLMFVAGWLAARGRGERESVALRAMFLAAAVLFAMSLRIGDFSIWMVVARYVPGATAIRAVGRIVFIILAFAIPLILRLWQRFLEELPTRRAALFGAAVFVLAVLEQGQKGAISGVPGRWERVNRLADVMRGSEVAAWRISGPRLSWQEEVMDAQWATLVARCPIVNGYTRRFPPGYPPGRSGPFDVSAWLSQMGRPVNARVVWPAGADPAELSLVPQLHLQSERHGEFDVLNVSCPLPRVYGQCIHVLRCPARVGAGSTFAARIDVRNTSSFPWPAVVTNAVQATYQWMDAKGRFVPAAERWTEVPSEMYPGDRTNLSVRVTAPEAPGRFSLAFTMLKPDEARFVERGAKWGVTQVEVAGQ